jgi:regulator of protease activity HflC (stomatin/prohibitin superfamily)
MLAARPGMRVPRWAFAVVGSVATAAVLAGCGTTIGNLNLRPEQHYEEKVSFKGRIVRREPVGGETLLELADEREARILVKVNGAVNEEMDTWVKVDGVLVPEARIGSQILYDIVVADEISSTRAPLLPNLM